LLLLIGAGVLGGWRVRERVQDGLGCGDEAAHQLATGRGDKIMA
jgi:hypothetical protein